MYFSDFLQIIAVLLEMGVAVIALLIATRYRKSYGWCIAVTFSLYVLFDLGRIFVFPVPDAAHSLILLIACGSMLYGVWMMYSEQALLQLLKK